MPAVELPDFAAAIDGIDAAGDIVGETRRVVGEEGVDVREEDAEMVPESAGEPSNPSTTVQSSPDDLGDAENECADPCSSLLGLEEDEASNTERGEGGGFT